ncbi:hypothetical protein SDC9_73860 [bioreactor metagenome]|uniref:Uncharacterized protein n=1 Tax=bioreactor metagenome TaxID=1076179 RepID=A0A644YFX6_9ZZZZ
MVLDDGFLRRLFDFKIQLTHESGCAHHAQGIFPEAFFRIADCPDQFVRQVLLPVEEVFDVPMAVDRNRIDRKVAPFQVVLQTAHILDFLRSAELFIL